MHWTHDDLSDDAGLVEGLEEDGEEAGGADDDCRLEDEKR